jgi:peroxiredoxin
MSRRTVFALVVSLLLLAAWWVAPWVVRKHVDGVIQGAVDKPLPAFTAIDHTGRTWTAAALQGKRALLHFFRSKCHSCDVEAPELRALEAALPADVVLLHVMTDRVLDFAPELTAATIAGKAFTRPILLADAAFVNAFHSVRWSNVTPITYVVDARGTVRTGLRGAQSRAAIEQALAAVQ